MKLIVSLFLVLSNWPSSLPTPPQESIAFVTALKGTVKLQRGQSTPSRITRTTFLQEGDVIMVGSEGSAWFYQAYARPEQLQPNQSKSIKRLAPSSGSGVMDADEYTKLAILTASSLQNRAKRSPAKMGGPDDLTVTAISPRKSLVIDEHPTFEWTPVKDVRSYLFAIYDAKQDKPVWETTTKEPRVTYPDSNKDKSIKPLLPGEYTWEVTAEVDQNHKAYDAAEFVMATPAQATAVRASLKKAEELVADKGGINLFYIQAVFEHQLYPRAETELKRALRRTPDDETLWALLMQAYEDMKRYEDRNRIFDYLKDPKPAEEEKILGNGISSEKK